MLLKKGHSVAQRNAIFAFCNMGRAAMKREQFSIKNVKNLHYKGFLWF